MSHSIQVTNKQNQEAWRKDLAQDEFQQVKEYCNNGGFAYPVILTAFFPVRTNSIQNFAEDFFLPTVILHAIKVQNTARKIFVILIALVFDIMTFPIRLLTCIPRVIWNAQKSEQALLTYLKKEKVQPKLIASNQVRVTFYTSNSEDDESFSTTTDSRDKMDVNFIDLPSNEFHRPYTHHGSQSGVAK